MSPLVRPPSHCHRILDQLPVPVLTAPLRMGQTLNKSQARSNSGNALSNESESVREVTAMVHSVINLISSLNHQVQQEMMEGHRDHQCSQRTLGAFISSFVMIIGSWGPASDEEGDVGENHFYYPALITLHGIFGMVMGMKLALQVLLFMFAPEYGIFMVICIYLIDRYIIH